MYGSPLLSYPMICVIDAKVLNTMNYAVTGMVDGVGDKTVSQRTRR